MGTTETSSALRNPYVIEPLRTLVRRLATQVFCGPEYRVTMLCSRTRADAVEPFLRWDGSEVQELTSRVLQFPRNAPIAGLAMMNPWRAYVLELPSFASDAQLVAFYVKEFGLDPKHADSLRGGSMKSRRGILCLGFNTPLNLVLSVDSDREHAFVDDGSTALRHAEQLTDELRLFTPVLSELSFARS